MLAYPTAARTAVAVEMLVMKAAGPAGEVVDRIDTSDSAVKTEDSVMAVDEVDVDDTAAGSYTYFQTDSHTAPVFSMNHA